MKTYKGAVSPNGLIDNYKPLSRAHTISFHNWVTKEVRDSASNQVHLRGELDQRRMRMDIVAAARGLEIRGYSGSKRESEVACKNCLL